MSLQQSHEDQTVCVVGMGQVGLTLAVLMASIGFAVHGIERDERRLKLLHSGEMPFYEKGLAGKLHSAMADGSLRFSASCEAAGQCSVYVVAVGTELTEDGKATDLAALHDAVAMVRSCMAGGELVVIRSTVAVGVCRQLVKPQLDARGVAYDLAYCPERTLTGNAFEELASLPQLVAGLTPAASKRAARLFAAITAKTIELGSLEAAELGKLATNAYRDMTFAFANELAMLSDHMGINVIEVISAANSGYPRNAIAAPGPVGGSCLGKDPMILSESAAQHGYQSVLPGVARSVNAAVPQHVARQAALHFQSARPEPGLHVAMLGLAFKGKPQTSDTRGSLALPILAELQAKFGTLQVLAHDPLAKGLPPVAAELELTEDPYEAARQADLVIIQTNHADYAALDLQRLSRGMAPGGLIYDLWNLFEPAGPLAQGVRYAGLGRWLPVNGL